MAGKLPGKGPNGRRQKIPQPWRRKTRPNYTREQWRSTGVTANAEALSEAFKNTRTRTRIVETEEGPVKKKMVFRSANDQKILRELNEIIATPGAYDFLQGRRGTSATAFYHQIVRIIPDPKLRESVLLELKKIFRGA